jgi:glutathione synthase/RimK-type ligase-like ATP-grasp enzyme
MKIGIHSCKFGFSERWIAYCKSNSIPFKIVNCYSSDIIEQLSDCNALMWHFQQDNPKDFIFAKQLMYALQTKGIEVFPDFNTMWHFDDKVGQKYLLEGIGAPLAASWVFYDKHNALKWANHTEFPKVFKLRGGAGSQNVRLIRSKRHAKSLIRKAFSRGFPVYNPVGSLKERWRKYKLGKTNLRDIIKGAIRFVLPPPYASIKGRDKGYIYFQEYIPGNKFDIRVIVIGDKAFAIKRMVRKDDFRASGSGIILYGQEHFNKETISLSFQMAEQIKSQCAAFDFVYTRDKIFVVEVSYGFVKEGYDPCTGYWDINLNWHEGQFNPCGWMVESVRKSINHKNS